MSPAHDLLARMSALVIHGGVPARRATQVLARAVEKRRAAVVLGGNGSAAGNRGRWSEVLGDGAPVGGDVAARRLDVVRRAAALVDRMPSSGRSRAEAELRAADRRGGEVLVVPSVMRQQAAQLDDLPDDASRGDGALLARRARGDR